MDRKETFRVFLIVAGAVILWLLLRGVKRPQVIENVTNIVNNAGVDWPDIGTVAPFAANYNPKYAFNFNVTGSNAASPILNFLFEGGTTTRLGDTTYNLGDIILPDIPQTVINLPAVDFNDKVNDCGMCGGNSTVQDAPLLPASPHNQVAALAAASPNPPVAAIVKSIVSAPAKTGWQSGYTGKVYPAQKVYSGRGYYSAG